MADKSIGNNLWSEEARAELLHILPQATYHDQAEIRGSNAALRRLGEALMEASKKGQCQQVKVNMMASDGEGYQVVIQPMSDQQMDAGSMPYAQLGQDWEFIRNDTKYAHIVHNAHALIEAADNALTALICVTKANDLPSRGDAIREEFEREYRPVIEALRFALSKINGGGNAQ